MRIEDIHDVLGTEFCDGSVTKSDKKPNLSKSMSWEKAIKQNEFMFVKIPVHIAVSYTHLEVYKRQRLI